MTPIRVITGFTIVPANVDECEVLWDVVDSIYGLLIGDKGYLCPFLKQELLEQGVELHPFCIATCKTSDPKAFVKSFMSVRRLVETVIGRLVGRPVSHHGEKIGFYFGYPLKAGHFNVQ